jgi:hypothetical protein
MRAGPRERDFNALPPQSWRMRYEPTANANLGEVVGVMGASIRTKRARPGERDFNALPPQSWRMR